MLSSSCRRSTALGWEESAGSGKESVARLLGRRADKNADAPGMGTTDMLVADGEGNQPKSGVGNAGHPGVGDERDTGSAFEIDNEFGGARHLVVLVVAHSFRFDDVVVQQLLKPAISLQAMTSASLRMRSAGRVLSLRLPIGVPTM